MVQRRLQLRAAAVDARDTLCRLSRSERQHYFHASSCYPRNAQSQPCPIWSTRRNLTHGCHLSNATGTMRRPWVWRRGRSDRISRRSGHKLSCPGHVNRREARFWLAAIVEVLASGPAYTPRGAECATCRVGTAHRLQALRLASVGGAHPTIMPHLAPRGYNAVYHNQRRDVRKKG